MRTPSFAAAFQVPLLYFFLPPKPDEREASGVMIGDRLVAWPDLLDVMLDGKHLFEARDGRLAIPGRFGIWSRADNATVFGDLFITILD